MATWTDVYQWCQSNRAFTVGGLDGPIFEVRASFDGDDGVQTTRTAMVLHTGAVGLELVMIQCWIGPVLDQSAYERYLLTLSGIWSDPDVGWAAPYGLASMPGIMDMRTSFPLAELPRSQFDFALVQILGSSDVLLRRLGVH